jgi:16S rRNA (adenine1518-N6/adenine1519-N6)-dimethyltransferase
MVDERSLEKVVDAADIESTDHVVEVGTGTGLLTKRLAQRASEVVTVEIDKGLQQIAKTELAGIGNIRWIEGDILQIDPERIRQKISDVHALKIVSNPPYSISTPLLQYFLSWDPIPPMMVFTFQKEVIDRMKAKPGSKEYGSLSLFTQYHCDVQVAGKISKSAFFPVPEVDSQIVVLTPKVHRDTPETQRTLFTITRAVFQQRRKTLLNALKRAFPNISDVTHRENIKSLGLAEAIRGEALPLDAFLRLAQKYSPVT